MVKSRLYNTSILNMLRQSEIYITRVDLQNFLAKERAINLKTDAPLMVAHFCLKVAENPGYVFEFETDKDGRLTNASWICPDAVEL
ncbi:hypothetical protein PsorP6_011132 [Peronosclerospora sorghi]|uniref:Uncharacterized protein n=1 Tax=Peronosclerospora sorghi TaxID=230839 RepID=A0ACC0VUL0_9STRA|nr:hypothetical protein PsorP6_011132 [Peronosclerospora sorghi]